MVGFIQHQAADVPHLHVCFRQVADVGNNVEPLGKWGFSNMWGRVKGTGVMSEIQKEWKGRV